MNYTRCPSAKIGSVYFARHGIIDYLCHGWVEKKDSFSLFFYNYGAIMVLMA